MYLQHTFTVNSVLFDDVNYMDDKSWLMLFVSIYNNTNKYYMNMDRERGCVSGPFVFK